MSAGGQGSDTETHAKSNTKEVQVALQEAYPQAVASLIRNVGSIDAGEEAVQEAVLRALKHWPGRGIPEQPAAWLVRAGTNYHTDQVRHRQMRRNHQVELVNSELRRFRNDDDAVDGLVFADDLLRLTFTCVHPELSPDAQIALTLKVVLGFSVQTIANSLLVAPKTIEKRITRAKTKLAALDEGYRVPKPEELTERLNAVLQTIYLVFNAGFDQSFSAPEPGEDLCVVGIRLARMLRKLFKGNSECQSLLALCLLIHGRKDARIDASGGYIPLSEHDRSRWNWALVDEGRVLIDAVFERRLPAGYYQLQAAIAALHSVADAATTDWAQISGLYQRLMDISQSPVISLNAAVALANAGQPQQALVSLDVLGEDHKLHSYQPFYAARAHVLSLLQDWTNAAYAYDRAIELAPNNGAKQWLERKRQGLTARG